jgi:ABC-type multidrug transport system permease subunit
MIPGMQNRVGGLFFLCVFFALTAMSSLGVFVGERRMYLREYAAGFYSPISYFLASVTSDLVPLRIFPPFLFGLIAYWMMGLQAKYDKFLIFLVGSILVNCVATALCLVCFDMHISNTMFGLGPWFSFGLCACGSEFNSLCHQHHRQ